MSQIFRTIQVTQKDSPGVIITINEIDFNPDVHMRAAEAPVVPANDSASLLAPEQKTEPKHSPEEAEAEADTHKPTPANAKHSSGKRR